MRNYVATLLGCYQAIKDEEDYWVRVPNKRSVYNDYECSNGHRWSWGAE